MGEKNISMKLMRNILGNPDRDGRNCQRNSNHPIAKDDQALVLAFLFRCHLFRTFIPGVHDTHRSKNSPLEQLSRPNFQTARLSLRREPRCLRMIEGLFKYKGKERRKQPAKTMIACARGFIYAWL